MGAPSHDRGGGGGGQQASAATLDLLWAGSWFRAPHLALHPGVGVGQAARAAGGSTSPGVWSCGLIQNAVTQAGSPLTNERGCTRGTTVQASDHLLSSADTPLFHVSPCPVLTQYRLLALAPLPQTTLCLVPSHSAVTHSVPAHHGQSHRTRLGGTTLHSASQTTWRSPSLFGRLLVPLSKALLHNLTPPGRLPQLR